jgi:hypothetical protein
MSAKHTLAARLRDLRIEFELWVAAWLATSTVLTATVYLYLQPAVNAGLWRDYLLARVLDFIGLGAVSIQGWHTPALVIQFVREEVPAGLVTIWERDLVLLLQAPFFAIVALPLAYLVFFDKKA